jgi:hypothetical protein
LICVLKVGWPAAQTRAAPAMLALLAGSAEVAQLPKIHVGLTLLRNRVFEILMGVIANRYWRTGWRPFKLCASNCTFRAARRLQHPRHPAPEEFLR